MSKHVQAWDERAGCYRIIEVATGVFVEDPQGPRKHPYKGVDEIEPNRKPEHRRIASSDPLAGMR